MRSPLRVLIIAHAFPPSAEVGGSRIARFCKYLPEFGVQPVVLTVQNRFHERLDHTILVPPTIRVIRTLQYRTPLDWYASWKSRRSAANSRRDNDRPKAQRPRAETRGRLRQYLLSVLLFPDQYWGWYLPATRTGRRLLQTAEFDAVISTAPPPTALLIGLSLKMKYQIPWIVDFRDPWVDNESLPSSQPKWCQEQRLRMEANCVMSADLVVSNTGWQHRVMCERYQNLPREKFVTLTNGFDDVQAPPNLELKKHKPLLCLHVGTIYKGRRIDTFCAGLSILVKKKTLDPDAVRVLFVGDTDESQITACREVAGELIDSGMIEFHKHVAKEEASLLLWKADLLLVFQGEYHTQIPFKFYEYFATGKPIFAIAQQGALSSVMEQMGVGIWTAENDPHEIGKKFLLALSLSAQPAEAVQKRWAERFHFRSLSGQLAKWIWDIIDRPGDRGRSPNY